LFHHKKSATPVTGMGDMHWIQESDGVWNQFNPRELRLSRLRKKDNSDHQRDDNPRRPVQMEFT